MKVYLACIQLPLAPTTLPLSLHVQDIVRVFVLHSDVSALAAGEAAPGVEWAAAASLLDLESEFAMPGQHLQGNESKDRAALVDSSSLVANSLVNHMPLLVVQVSASLACPDLARIAKIVEGQPGVVADLAMGAD